jgi:hypothetical protein
MSRYGAGPSRGAAGHGADPTPPATRAAHNRGMNADLAARLRDICLALPEVTERPSHGAPTWFAGGKKSFATLWADGHHDNRFPHLWCAGLPGAQEALVGSSPGRFFRPPYVGHRGWIGVRLDGTLDGTLDWGELAELCADGYRAVAPARLIALLDAR